MTVEKTEIALSVTGEEATARAMQNVARSMASVQTATAKVNEAQKVQSITAASVTAQFARLGPAVGIVSQGLGAMNGTLGKVGTVLGSTTSAIAGMTAGFGPLGIALGVVSAAFTAYNFVVKDAEEKSKALEAAAREATKSLADQARAIRSAREQREADRLTMETEEGLLVRLAHARAEYNQRLSDAPMASSTVQAELRVAALERQLADAQAMAAAGDELRRAREETERMIADAEAMGDVLDRGDGGRRRERRDESSLEPVVREDQGPTVGEIESARRESEFAAMAGKLEAMDQQLEVQRAAEAAEAQERYNQINAEGLRIAQDRAKERELEIEQLGMVTDMWGNLAGVMAGSVAGALEAVAKGEMSLGQAFRKVIADRLKGTAIEESVMALVSLAKAASLSVWNPAGAAQELTAAALHGQAAAMAGAGAGIAYAIGSGGGGGGGSAAPSSQPTRDTSAQPSGSGERVININFGSPVVTASTIAELGRELKTAIVTAEAKGWA